MAKRVTLQDVAERCGLSLYPVSRALNGKPGVTPETVARVRAVATALGYDPRLNQGARRLALRRSGQQAVNHVIGLLVPGQLGKVRYFFEQFRGLTEAATAAGYGLLYVPTYDPVRGESLPWALPPSVLRGEVDGLVVHSGLDESLLQHLREETEFGGRPVVAITGYMPGCRAVLRDEYEGARLALAHLLELGHRRVLYLRRSVDGYPMSAREQGYRDACRATGVEAAAGLRPVWIEHDDPDGMALPLRQALAQEPQATAVLAMHDPSALAAIYLLQRWGYRVPDDFSVVGWDDTDPWPDAGGENRLTSVHFDIAEMGRQAVQVLLASIGGAPPAADIIIPASLVCRGSTALPRT